VRVLYHLGAEQLHKYHAERAKDLCRQWCLSRFNILQNAVEYQWVTILNRFLGGAARIMRDPQ